VFRDMTNYFGLSSMEESWEHCVIESKCYENENCLFMQVGFTACSSLFSKEIIY
jgi:hypothetical protein